jgi:hypothetical protein
MSKNVNARAERADLVARLRAIDAKYLSRLAVETVRRFDLQERVEALRARLPPPTRQETAAEVSARTRPAPSSGPTSKTRRERIAAAVEVRKAYAAEAVERVLPSRADVPTIDSDMDASC